MNQSILPLVLELAAVGILAARAINNGLDSLIDARFGISTLVISPGNPNVLYAGTSGAGVLRSSDAGATWKSFNDGLAHLDIRALALAAGDAKTLFAGTPGGVFKIIDNSGPEK